MTKLFFRALYVCPFYALPSSFSIIFSHSFSITYALNENIFRVLLVNMNCNNIYLRPYSLTKKNK